MFGAKYDVDETCCEARYDAEARAVAVILPHELPYALGVRLCGELRVRLRVDQVGVRHVARKEEGGTPLVHWTKASPKVGRLFDLRHEKE